MKARHREYVVLEDADTVEASDPFEAMKTAARKRPELRRRSFSVVARSLVHHHDGRRWRK